MADLPYMQTVLLVLLAFVAGAAIGFGLRKALRARRARNAGGQVSDTFPAEPPAAALEAATGLTEVVPEETAEPAPQDKAKPEPKRRAASSKKSGSNSAGKAATRKAAVKKPAARKPRASTKSRAAPESPETSDTRTE